jgi:hypothetical protein
LAIPSAEPGAGPPFDTRGHAAMKGNNMRGNQRGMTLIGFIIGLMVACFFIYMGMTIGPAYNEFFGVKKAMNFVAANSDPNTTDMVGLQKMLDKQFNVGYVDNVTGSQVKLIREKGGNSIDMNYEVRKPFVYNIDFAIKFDYKVKLGNKSGGG